MRLAGVLSASDLPLAELSAARLDGELFGMNMAYCPIDAIDSPELRAESVLPLPEPLIAERRTAAWIWGATAQPPRVHEFCTSLGARGRAAGPLPMTLREVMIEPADVVRIAGLRVTTPFRTLLDIVRSEARCTDATSAAVRALADLARVDAAECIDYLNSKRHLPHKRRAIQHLAAILG